MRRPSKSWRALQALNRLDDALASYDEALALKPDYPEAFYNRGIALQGLNRLDDALASYDKALALKLDFAEVFNNRGNALQELRRFDEALSSYDQAFGAQAQLCGCFQQPRRCAAMPSAPKRGPHSFAAVVDAVG